MRRLAAALQPPRGFAKIKSDGKARCRAEGPGATFKPKAEPDLDCLTVALSEMTALKLVTQLGEEDDFAGGAAG